MNRKHQYDITSADNNNNNAKKIKDNKDEKKCIMKWDDELIEVNPNHNLYINTKVNNSGDEYIFYGVALEAKWFWVYLLKTDKEFGNAMLQIIKKSDDQFAKYNIKDIIEDIFEEDDPMNYKRRYKSKTIDQQCADDFGSDLAFELLRVKVFDDAKTERLAYISRCKKRKDPWIPVSEFYAMDIEYHITDDEGTDVVYIGKKYQVYNDGVLVLSGLPEKIDPILKIQLLPIATMSDTIVGFQSYKK
jgi:hypothetical protein